MRIPIVSLFSGSGGLDLGFEQAGFETIAAYDVFPAAVKTFNFNRGRQIARLGDVSALSGQTIAEAISASGTGTVPIGVIGGPPCQAFSRSNVYPREDDMRRTLPGHFARVLKELRAFFPVRFFTFENVQGITFRRHKEEFGRFRFMFEEAGFVLYEALLNAKDYGVPQDRPRVIIVGIDKNLTIENGNTFMYPLPVDKHISVRQAFDGVFGKPDHPAPAFFKRNLDTRTIPFHPNHWTLAPKSEKFHNGTLKEGEIKGRSFRVLAWDKPSWTVAYGHREVHVHPSGKRRLSVFEAMTLQGFPTTYRLLGNLSEQIKLVSDAVPPPLAYHVASQVKLALGIHGETVQLNGVSRDGA